MDESLDDVCSMAVIGIGGKMYSVVGVNEESGDEVKTGSVCLTIFKNYISLPPKILSF